MFPLPALSVQMLRLRPKRVGRWLSVAVMLLSCAAPSVCARASTADVLDKPSVESRRASTRVMLAVTRAGKRLIAVGERGIVLLSDDNGNSWRQARVPVSTTLTSAYFPTADKGWAVGHSGVILHSSDGGETWTRQLDGIRAASLVAESARERVKALGEQAARTLLTDAERLVADGPDKPFLDVYFFDERRGLVVGAYGLAFRTDDGGNHWLPVIDIPNPGGKHLYAIHAGNREMWLVGEQGALFRSKDQGASFVEAATPYNGTLFGLVSGVRCNLVAFGLRGNAFHSDDCGDSWQKIDNSIEATLTAGLRLSDGSLVLVDQAGRILKSTNEGRSFVALPGNRPFPITGIGQGTDGSLVLSSVRGVLRASPIPPTDSQK